jgi:predicted nucleotidyltransferase
MAVIGVALYGSRARQDHEPGADTDILAVITGHEPRSSHSDGLSLSWQPLGRLVSGAGIGDLFVLHIVSEARVLFEAWPVFDLIRRSFRYKDDYRREIGLASDVGWFLLRHGDRSMANRLVGERMAWSVRTILIARAADLRRPIFGPDALAEFAGLPDVRELIRSRDRTDSTRGMMRETFRMVLEAFGTAEPREPRTIDDWSRHFERDRNVMGSRSVRAVAIRMTEGTMHARP